MKYIKILLYTLGVMVALLGLITIVAILDYYGMMIYFAGACVFGVCLLVGSTIYDYNEMTKK